MPEPIKNSAYSFELGLIDQANRPQFKVNPTLAAGDFKISKNGGALTNLATLPTILPAGSRGVLVSLSAAEMNTGRWRIECIDAAGSEWDDVIINLEPTVLPVLLNGTASAGGNESITLAAGSYDLTGCIVRTTGGAGAGQARVIVLYNTATLEAIVEPVWDSVIDNTTTYDVLLTEMALVAAINAKTDQLTFTVAGVVNANPTLINNNATAARRLGQMFGAVELITVNSATFAPTTTVFETEATDDVDKEYLNQVLLCATGDNAGVSVRVTAYAFTNGKVKLTVSELETAPANGDTFIKLGVIPDMTLADGTITDAKFTLPAVAGVATGVLGMIQQTWRRFFKKATMPKSGNGDFKTFADNGVTVITTQAVTDDGTTQTLGPSV